MTDGPQHPPSRFHQPQPPAWHAEPDWEALAEESRARARRKRLLLIAGGVLAVAAIGGAVSAAVVSANSRPAASPSATAIAPVPSLPPESAFPSVAAPSPENPLTVLSSAGRDSAPLSAGALFPARNLNRAGRTYVRTNLDGPDSCSAAAAGVLAAKLVTNGCRQVFRATYRSGGIAVTVGVAVFGTRAQADNVKDTAQYIRPLDGGGIADFCHAVACRMSANAVGRYAYFTISGLTDNQPLTAADTRALQAGDDVAAVTFQLIVQRGRDEAEAALTASPVS